MKFFVLVGIVVLAAVPFALAQTNPVPFVDQPLVPTAATSGGSSFTLTVNGTGFVSTSEVHWNGAALSTVYVSSSLLTATVPAASIATAGTGSVTVVNPASGGGTSNVTYFDVSVLRRKADPRRRQTGGRPGNAAGQGNHLWAARSVVRHAYRCISVPGSSGSIRDIDLTTDIHRQRRGAGVCLSEIAYIGSRDGDIQDIQRSCATVG
jgi:hypothetical protein